MGDIGNRAPAMRLECKTCGWIPPGDLAMGDAQLHFQVEHDTDEVTFSLTAPCTCGANMTVTASRPTGGGIKDHLLCLACGNTGYLRRDTP